MLLKVFVWFQVCAACFMGLFQVSAKLGQYELYVRFSAATFVQQKYHITVSPVALAVIHRRF